jgi:hypothetical protein
MAHILVCLRIAVVVTHAVARLATDLRDCALVGRVSHPLDRIFRISRASGFSFLSDQPFLVATIPPFPIPSDGNLQKRCRRFIDPKCKVRRALGVAFGRGTGFPYGRPQFRQVRLCRFWTVAHVRCHAECMRVSKAG